MGIIKEFKEFPMEDSVIDMAIGIIIGAGFGGDSQFACKRCHNTPNTVL